MCRLCHRYRVALGFLAMVFLLAPTQAAEKKAEALEVNFELLQRPTEQDRNRVQEWLIDLETTSILADQIAVVATGEYFIAASAKGRQTVNAKRFAFCWGIDNANDRERVLFGSQNLIHPAAAGNLDARYAGDNATRLDQLRLGQQYYEAVGSQVRAPAKKSALTPLFKLNGLFFPVSACSETAAGLYSGNTREPEKAGVEIERLMGYYKRGEYRFAEFVRRSDPRITFHRILIFKDGVPVQVDDWTAYADRGSAFPPLELNEPSKQDQQELKRTRKQLRPLARNFIRWSKLKDLRVPVALRSMTIGEPTAIEVEAAFVWMVNEEVAVELFAPENVGRLGPLAVLE